VNDDFPEPGPRGGGRAPAAEGGQVERIGPAALRSQSRPPQLHRGGDLILDGFAAEDEARAAAQVERKHFSRDMLAKAREAAAKLEAELAMGDDSDCAVVLDETPLVERDPKTTAPKGYKSWADVRAERMAKMTGQATPTVSVPVKEVEPTEDGWRQFEVAGEPEFDCHRTDPDGVVVRASNCPHGDRKARSHSNQTKARPVRRFDTTALHYDLHAKIVSHADYIAHSEKWDFCIRSIQKGDRILDVGCGTDLPFMYAIVYSQTLASKVLHREGGCYVGVDLNKLKTTGQNWATLLPETDMTSDEGYNAALEAIPGNDDAAQLRQPLRGYTMIVALEIIEHMDVADGRKLLQNMLDLLDPGGRVYLSTPVYDGKAQARNHIHEYYIDELRELIESVGFVVEKRYGTFTAEPQLKKWLKENRPDWYKLYMEAREFHSAGYMSGVIAPMVPDLARNNLWVLRKP